MEKVTKYNLTFDQVEYFFCTGKDRQGKKFRRSSNSLSYLNCINAYSNKITWAKLKNGKRIKL